MIIEKIGKNTFFKVTLLLAIAISISSCSKDINPNLKKKNYLYSQFDSEGSETAALEKNLIHKALQHPTSKLITKSSNYEEYLHHQKGTLTHASENLPSDEALRKPASLFGSQLSPKEKESLSHQNDLFAAYLKNEELAEKLNEAGFDKEAYLAGSYESDLGKLQSYQNLFTEKSAKAELLYLFLQGKGPSKSVEQLKLALEEMNEPALPFLNPNISPKKIRKTFKNYPILKGFLHELPGMIDAVLAYEVGLISAESFRKHIHVNLFHCGPSAGYWQLLKSHLIPQSFEQKGEESLFKELFKGSIYAKNGGHTLYYGPPSTFESFTSTLFDRLSQATAGGYRKIDWEIGGNPLHNANNLLLEKNVPWTIEQIVLIREQIKKSPLLDNKKKEVLNELTKDSISYLDQYHQRLKKLIKFETNSEGLTLTFIKTGETITYKYATGKYFSRGRSLASKDEARKVTQEKMQDIFKQLESELGDPFTGKTWRHSHSK